MNTGDPIHRWHRINPWYIRNMFIVCVSVIVYIGNAPPSATALVTPDEINTVRVYKKIAEVTVLIASAYASAHHITQGTGKGIESGVLIDDQG